MSRVERKARRRAAQLAKEKEKAEAELSHYLKEQKRLHRSRGQVDRRAFQQVFGEHAPAGINFSQYSDVAVERSGEGSDTTLVLRAFSDLGDRLPPFLSSNVSAMRYETPTPIQANAIPLSLQGIDVMCSAQTGSGKTCAFLLPLLARLDQLRSTDGDYFIGTASAPRALVLAPTRELAMQIHLEACKLAHGSSLRAVSVYGGAKARPQLSALAAGCDILVGTPGRIQDFLERGILRLDVCTTLVLDEADRMLDMGFEPQVRRIVERSTMPRGARRQTMMFSATFPKEIQRLAGAFLNPYCFISVGRVGSTVSAITQRLVLASNDKRAKLALLRDHIMDANSALSMERTLVFVKKKATASWLAKQLRKKRAMEGLFEVNAAEIHGDRSQPQREEALRRFRAGEVKVLVATDVAARGLDIPGVDHVVNFDLGSTDDDFDSYVHRIGRTGRAGNTGIATSFYVPGTDPKVGSGNIAKKLLALLQESGQGVPSWLLEQPEVRGGRTGRQQQDRDARAPPRGQGARGARQGGGRGRGNRRRDSRDGGRGQSKRYKGGAAGA